jgi:hypothetical protein
MSEEGFLRRWARRKTEVREGREPAPEPSTLGGAPADAAAAPVGASAFAGPQPAPSSTPMPIPVPVPEEGAPEPARPLPTLEDVAALDADSDFSAFVARGVDQAVRRSALKKLFADPHFKVMDRLDVYIDDYNKPSPMSEAMLASLEHAKSVFMKMAGDEPEAEAQAETEQQSQAQQPPEQETQ